MTHPGDNDLALLAGGEAAGVRRLALGRHVRRCVDCQERVAQFQDLRAQLGEMEMPELNWSSLAAEMQANIRLGLEAGACVRARRVSIPKFWNPRLALAFASVLVLVASGFFARNVPAGRGAADPAAAVLRSTGAGIELRTGSKSLTLLSHHGAAAGQTVSARGEIGARYVDAETGSVTITNAYLPQ